MKYTHHSRTQINDEIKKLSFSDQIYVNVKTKYKYEELLFNAYNYRGCTEKIY